jgi:hypothetical protein
VSAIFVVVLDKIGHEPYQMALVEDDHMVKQIAAAVADEAFRDAVLPRVFERRVDGLCAEDSRSLHNFRVEVRVAVVNQIAGNRVVGKRLAQLLTNPCARRVPGHAELQDATPVMGDDEETIEHAESERGHGEEIHGSNRLAVITQKRGPSFRRFGIPRRFPHPAQHRPLGDIEAEHLQLAVNTRCSPRGVLCNHAEDELAQFHARRLSADTNPFARDPLPIEPESGAMPANNCFRLHDEKRLLPTRPEASQNHPEQPILSSKMNCRMISFQSGKLLPQGQAFQEKIAARIERSSKQNEQKFEHCSQNCSCQSLPKQQRSNNSQRAAAFNS